LPRSSPGGVSTGSGGSIGSELARQVAAFCPAQLLLVERFEGALFEIDRELTKSYPDVSLVPLVADITDWQRMSAIFQQYTPDVVVHAAAHKHVAMMEENPGEAVKNNALGTRLIAEMAGRSRADCFIQVSTDKAVRPTSIMGASKRLAEMVVQRCNETYPDTRYVAVRFGNVLGSSGSVVPIFKAQVRAGGPVTVTHEDATRYFKTIPEASCLVLTAGAIGEGGEVMVLDMGKPVRVLDLARNLIRLSGFVPNRDIPIEITGLRPGEKLSEELYSETENMGMTRHPKILVGTVSEYRGIDGVLEQLAASLVTGHAGQIRRLMAEALDSDGARLSQPSVTDEEPAGG
jgi:FlaA1/EpsC-like NDP-sugar epimerase